MYTIKSQDFWLSEDFESLRREYQQEDKTIYQHLYKTYIFSDIRREIESKGLFRFCSKIGTFVGIDIQIVVDTYIRVETSFFSPTNLQENASTLRKDSNFRCFTKLCLYIEEHVEPL